jgi:DNA-binding NarL/FixJ family response regulator
VAGLVAQGWSNKQIARRLNVSIHTVENHVYQVLKKLHLRRRRDVLFRSRGIGV